MKLRALLPLALLAAGCGDSVQSWQPLDVGSDWTYQIRAGLLTSVDHIRVQRAMPVAGVSGVSLTTPGGETRLAWKDGVLFADMLGGTRYSPPLPLCSPRLEEKKVISWRGILTVGHRSFGGEAELRQSPDAYLLASKRTDALRCDLTIEVNRQVTEVGTWFVRGIGMVRQEERTRDQLVRAIEYVAGP